MYRSWKSDNNGVTLSKEERIALRDTMRAARETAQQEIILMQDESAKKAEVVWGKAHTDSSFTYCTLKGVDTVGVRFC